VSEGFVESIMTDELKKALLRRSIDLAEAPWLEELTEDESPPVLASEVLGWLIQDPAYGRKWLEAYIRWGWFAHFVCLELASMIDDLRTNPPRDTQHNVVEKVLN
jgi:hypothetical protein